MAILQILQSSPQSAIEITQFFTHKVYRTHDSLAIVFTLSMCRIEVQSNVFF